MTNFEKGIYLAEAIEENFSQKKSSNKNERPPLENLKQELTNLAGNTALFIPCAIITHLQTPLIADINQVEIRYLQSIGKQIEIFNALSQEDERCFLPVCDDLSALGGLKKATISLFTGIPEKTVEGVITEGLIRKIKGKHWPGIYTFESVIQWWASLEKLPSKEFAMGCLKIWRTVWCHYSSLPDDIDGTFPPACLPASDIFMKSLSGINASYLKVLQAELITENKKEIDAKSSRQFQYYEYAKVKILVEEYVQILFPHESQDEKSKQEIRILRMLFPNLERVCEKCFEISKERILSRREYSANWNAIPHGKIYSSHMKCPNCLKENDFINQDQALDYIPMLLR